MVKRSLRGTRESALGAGWIVEDVSGNVTAAPAAPPAEDATIVTPPLPGVEHEAPAQLSNVTMVLLGVIGGLYLAYTWIWLSWTQYIVTATGAQLSLTSGSAGAALQLVLYWLAPVAPILWFVTVVALHRHRSPARMCAWLAVGAVILVPLPYVLTETAGAASVALGLLAVWGAL